MLCKLILLLPEYTICIATTQYSGGSYTSLAENMGIIEVRTVVCTTLSLVEYTLWNIIDRPVVCTIQSFI